jgi:hypothetical protein
MEAVRLIEATRQALARSDAVPDIVAEAWQTQALVEAVGIHLALKGPPALRAEALGLSEAGKRGCHSLRLDGQEGAVVRAARLSVVRDPGPALLALSRLLREAGTALVAVAVGAEEEWLYWQCIEAIDAADESGDRVAGVLRSMALPERGPAA